MSKEFIKQWGKFEIPNDPNLTKPISNVKMEIKTTIQIKRSMLSGAPEALTAEAAYRFENKKWVALDDLENALLENYDILELIREYQEGGQ